MARNNIQGSRTITRRAKDGDKGNDGSQGAFSIQKDWIIGDTHHNTSEVVDFIYVRGDSGATSYWYKKVTLGTNVASTPPQGGVTPYTISGVTYEKVSWLDTLAVKTFIAEGGNLGGLIFKNNRLISQRGTVNGQTSSDFNNPNFVPNILIDGNTGYVEFANAKIRGEIEAIMGRIGGFDIGANRLGNESSTAIGMSLYKDFIVFNKAGRQALIGATEVTGLPVLANFSDTINTPYDDKAGVSITVANGKTNSALNVIGDSLFKGGFSVLDNVYTSVGINAIYDNIRRFNSFYFSPSGDQIVYLPTRAQLINAFGSSNMPSSWSVEITISVNINSTGAIVLRGQSSSGDIRNNNGAIWNLNDTHQYGGIRMLRGDTVKLRFYSNNNCWLNMSHFD